MFNKPRLTTALMPTALSRPLIDGLVAPGTFEFDFVEVEPIHRAFAPMAQRQAYTICEMAIFTFLQAFALGKPVMLLPVVLAARFQHGCLVYHRDHHLSLTTADLPGKTVGVRSYTQTTGAWVRNILSREHGLDLRSIKWVTYEGAHLAEYAEPSFVQRAPADASLMPQFLAGQVDAAILGNDLPADPSILPVIPNAAMAGPALFARTGLVPINHMLTIERSFARENPAIVRDLYTTFERARIEAALEDSEAALRPFGFSAIAPSLAAVIDLAREQEIIAVDLSVEDLFDDAMQILGALA